MEYINDEYRKELLIGDFVHNFTDEIYLQMEAVLAMYVTEAMRKLGKAQAFTGMDLEPVADEIVEVWSKYLVHLDRKLHEFIDRASKMAGEDLSTRYKHHVKDLVYDLRTYSKQAFNPQSKGLLDRFKSPNDMNVRRSLNKVLDLIRHQALPNSPKLDSEVWLASNKDMSHRGRPVRSLGSEIADELYSLSDATELRRDAHQFMKKHPMRSLRSMGM